MSAEADVETRVIGMLRGAVQHHRDWADANERMADMLEHSRRKDSEEEQTDHV